MERRLSEAARQGFSIALIPPGCDAVPPGMRALTASTTVAALQHMINIADHRANTAPGPQRLDA
ncbi:MAG: DNA repair protein RadA, partial [Mycobacterium sp.]